MGHKWGSAPLRCLRCGDLYGMHLATCLTDKQIEFRQLQEGLRDQSKADLIRARFDKLICDLSMKHGQALKEQFLNELVDSLAKQEME